MNTKNGLLTIRRNWYTWEFQQTVGKPDFQKLHKSCLSETQSSFQYPLQSSFVLTYLKTDDYLKKKKRRQSGRTIYYIHVLFYANLALAIQF